MSTHTLEVAIARDAETVFDAFTDPRNLPRWARAANPRAARDDWWIVDTPKGEARIRFHADRESLVVDHEYGDAAHTWHVPARIVRDQAGCVLSLDLAHPAGMDDAKFARQITAVTAELESFRRFVEATPEGSSPG